MSSSPNHKAAQKVTAKANDLTSELTQAAREVAATVKPKLRGWLHLGMVPLSIAAAVVLIVLAPTTAGRISAVVFGLTSVMLFSTSATYHRGKWSETVGRTLKRMDHANIFLIIAGTYTPFAVMLLPDNERNTLLWIAWSGALAGVAFRFLWVGAPRWLYTPVYVALGWVAVFYMGSFWENGGAAVVVLMAAGGLLYTLGAVVYGLKRPNPSPRWFGFHEIFHAFTVAAFICHYIAVSLAIYGATPIGV
ncbi:hemolysin III family protein [Ornithinimicrobium sp. Arc0846-15]|nr:hemolysin III family protein [Ornithinimicrobium laminariae]